MKAETLEWLKERAVFGGGEKAKEIFHHINKVNEAIERIKALPAYHPSAGDFNNNLKSPMIKRDTVMDILDLLDDHLIAISGRG